MSSISLDEQQLALLTPEEQAAIADDDYSEDEVKALKTIAGDDDTDDDDTDDDDDGDPDEVLDADGNPVAAAEPAAPVAEAKAAAPAADDAPAAKANTQYVAELPADFQEKIDGLKAKEDELRAQFKEGDIDLDEYEKKRDEILQERDALKAVQLKHEISREMRQQQAEATWHGQIEALLDRAKLPENGGIDYRTDQAKANDLDMFVKTLAGMPEHANKTGDWYLAEAHKRVLALHGVSASRPQETASKKPSRTPPVAAAPRTLAQVPGGDGPGDVGSEFAHLDALEGTALEDAIARMTPMQREKYALGR